MRARTWSAAALFLVVGAVAHAEPKPKALDIKSIRDRMLVLQDADGGTYVVLPGTETRLWYGAPKSKNLYEQIVTGRTSSTIEGTWDVSTWSPRVPNIQPGSVGRRADGTYVRWCGSDNNTALTEVNSDKTKSIIDKSTFLSTAMIRRPYLLARDDAGTYYYIDVIRNEYGGKGYRVFVGKKGAMKARPLTDIATDTAGDVFATKTGDLRIVRDQSADDKQTTTWVKGEKRTPLSVLDVDANSVLIYKDLGVYGFTGNICETL